MVIDVMTSSCMCMCMCISGDYSCPIVDENVAFGWEWMGWNREKFLSVMSNGIEEGLVIKDGDSINRWESVVSSEYAVSWLWSTGLSETKWKLTFDLQTRKKMEGMCCVCRQQTRTTKHTKGWTGMLSKERLDGGMEERLFRLLDLLFRCRCVCGQL